MKDRLMIATRIVVFLSCATSAFAQTRLDITLDGPWILYQDTTFASAPVLIAMAPGATEPSNPYSHHIPTFSAGDGFQIKPGLYCVTFDKTCAPPRMATSLSWDSYLKPAPLMVAAAKGWSWYDASFYSPSGIYLILPMPDSYSSDGVYNMRFAPAFDGTGKQYGKEEKHSIGVQLHYDKATLPQTLYLAQCMTPASTLNASHCTGYSKPLDNTGTLRIEMKAPDNNQACDPHVRSAYPKMLLMLDSKNLLTLGKNANQKIAYIDPAAKIDDSGNGVYPPECYQKCDPQNPDQTNCPPPSSTVMSDTMLDTKKALGQIVEKLSGLTLTDPQQGQVYLPQLTAERASLDENFPRLSQLAWIAHLLRLSALGIDDVRTQLQSFSKNDHAAPRILVSENKLQLLLQVENAEKVLAADLTKSGNDCRAPVMQVQ